MKPILQIILDTEITVVNNEIMTFLHRQTSRLLASLKSKLPEHYNRDTKLVDLHSAKNDLKFSKRSKK